MRGESINNSTVNFYNSYMNKEDESQAEWQDYTTQNVQNVYGYGQNQYETQQNQVGVTENYNYGAEFGGLKPRVV